MSASILSSVFSAKTQHTTSHQKNKLQVGDGWGELLFGVFGCIVVSHCCAVAAVPAESASLPDSLSLLDLLSDSLSSRGLAPPNILADWRESAIELTGSFTVRGSSFSRGRAAASSAEGSLNSSWLYCRLSESRLSLWRIPKLG